jgi:hypothetical protein
MKFSIGLVLEISLGDLAERWSMHSRLSIRACHLSSGGGDRSPHPRNLEGCQMTYAEAMKTKTKKSRD